MGQDDRCGICGKGSCYHLSLYREHIKTREGKALCGTRNAILNPPDCAVDPDTICRRCQKKFQKIHGITIADYQVQDSFTEKPVVLLV